MIRAAIIHLQGKLPVVADLRAAPRSSDQGVICTNMRTRDGKQPSFIEDSSGWFLIPMHEITVIELPVDAYDASNEPIALGSGIAEGSHHDRADGHHQPADELDTSPLETDEDLLARIRDL